MDFDFTAEDIALQEPLIPFTMPSRNDPGWRILDKRDDNDDDAPLDVVAQDGSDEESERTALLIGEADDMALVKFGDAGRSITSRHKQSTEGTVRRLCDVARQPGIEAEHKAKECKKAALQALHEGNTVLARERMYQGASHEQEAMVLHRRAACVIYAAHNEDLPADTIDLRGLRASEIDVIKTLLQTQHPELPAYRFILDHDNAEQRIALDRIARSLGLPHYHDGNVTHIHVRRKEDYVQDRLVRRLLKQAEDSRML